MKKFTPQDLRKLTVGLFLAVPFLSSLISTLHIVSFFGLGNAVWMSIVLAVAFEIGSIASLMTLTVLDRINRVAVWFIFIVLISMQMIGNVYYTYDYISGMIDSNPKWISSFIELVEMVTMQTMDQKTTKFVLSLLIGLPIPLVSLAFLKSVADYLRQDSPNASNESNNVDNVSPGEQPSLNYNVNDVVNTDEKVDKIYTSNNDKSILDVSYYEPENPGKVEETLPNDTIPVQEISSDVTSDIYHDDDIDESFFNDDTEEDEFDGFKEDIVNTDEKKS